jgi:hypothetical protein
VRGQRDTEQRRCQQGLLHVHSSAARPRTAPSINELAADGRKTERRAGRIDRHVVRPRPPRATRNRSGRSPGSRVARDGLHAPNGAFPCRAQWRSPFVDLAYRCGGSAGLAVCSHTTHRLPVSSLGREASGTPEPGDFIADIRPVQSGFGVKRTFAGLLAIVSAEFEYHGSASVKAQLEKRYS